MTEALFCPQTKDIKHTREAHEGRVVAFCITFLPCTLDHSFCSLDMQMTQLKN